MTDYKNRYDRQKLIVTKQNTAVAIIGAGSIGRQVAIQLSAMGISPITLCDHDTVDAINLGAQGFREADIGLRKVDAVRSVCAAMNSEIKIDVIGDIYKPENIAADVVFSCVDSIDTRREIYQAEKKKKRCALFLDARMAAECVKVVRCDYTSKKSVELYKKTLFKKSETYAERCTTRTTIYCASIAAGLLIAEFTRWMRGFHLMDECELNILGCMLTVERPTPE